MRRLIFYKIHQRWDFIDIFLLDEETIASWLPFSFFFFYDDEDVICHLDEFSMRRVEQYIRLITSRRWGEKVVLDRITHHFDTKRMPFRAHKTENHVEDGWKYVDHISLLLILFFSSNHFCFAYCFFAFYRVTTDNRNRSIFIDFHYSQHIENVSNQGSMNMPFLVHFHRFCIRIHTKSTNSTQSTRICIRLR